MCVLMLHYVYICIHVYVHLCIFTGASSRFVFSTCGGKIMTLYIYIYHNKNNHYIHIRIYACMYIYMYVYVPMLLQGLFSRRVLAK